MPLRYNYGLLVDYSHAVGYQQRRRFLRMYHPVTLHFAVHEVVCCLLSAAQDTYIIIIICSTCHRGRIILLANADFAVAICISTLGSVSSPSTPRAWFLARALALLCVAPVATVTLASTLTNYASCSHLRNGPLLGGCSGSLAGISMSLPAPRHLYRCLITCLDSQK
jgi:hypothetical protein